MRLPAGARTHPGSRFCSLAEFEKLLDDTQGIFHTRVKELQEDLDRQTEEKATATTSLEDALHELKTVKSHLSRVSAENRRLESEVQEKEQQVAGCMDERSAVEESKDELTDKLAKAEELLQASDTQASNCVRTLDGCSTQKGELMKNVTALQSLVRDAVDGSNHLHDALEELEKMHADYETC